MGFQFLVLISNKNLIYSNKEIYVGLTQMGSFAVKAGHKAAGPGGAVELELDLPGGLTRWAAITVASCGSIVTVLRGVWIMREYL